jgi:hypothetical protein
MVPLTRTYKILSILEPSRALAAPSTMILHEWLADTIPNGDRILTDPAVNGFIFLHPDSEQEAEGERTVWIHEWVSRS